MSTSPESVSAPPSSRASELKLPLRVSVSLPPLSRMSPEIDDPCWTVTFESPWPLRSAAILPDTLAPPTIESDVLLPWAVSKSIPIPPREFTLAAPPITISALPPPWLFLAWIALP